MKTYKNGNYIVYLLNNGTKIRYTKDNELIPERPESIDVCITEKCNMNCQFCFANCTSDGKHAKLFNADGTPVYWLSTVAPYTELAVNGNDMDHPQLEMFLKYCKEHNIIVSMTFHQKQFTDNYELIREYQKQGLLHGIGISISLSDYRTIELIKHTPNAVCHVINGIVTENVINQLANNNLKLLILGYKYKGRGVSYAKGEYYVGKNSVLNDNMKWLSDNVMNLSSLFDTVVFDCLATEQLNMKEKLSENDWNKYYMGKDGTTTFYIDAVNEKFAKSSTETEYTDIDNKSVNEMFNKILDK